MDNYQQWDWH